MELSIDLFLDHLRVERNLSHHTIAAYSHDLAGLCSWLGRVGVRRPEDVRREHVSGWSQSLTTTGHAVASQRRALSAVRSYFAYLVRQGQLRCSPAREVPLPKQGRRLPCVPSAGDSGHIIEGLRGDDPKSLRDRAALELLYGSGLRASELCSLTDDRLDLRSRQVRPLGKGGKERVVPLGTKAVAALHAYLCHGRELLRGNREDRHVFFGDRGRPLGRVGLYRIVRRSALRAGHRSQLSPHALRHAFATHMVQRGADLRSVQLMLGHASISTTEIYVHLGDTQLRQAVETHHPLGAAQSRHWRVDTDKSRTP